MKFKNEPTQTRTCPICGLSFTGVPGISRRDNKTEICPDCATREALSEIGIKAEEIDKIIKIVHGFENR